MYLISLLVAKNLKMRLMDVIIACLCGNLNNNIYMKALAGLAEFQHSQRHLQCLGLERALYGLKHVGMMGYKNLREFLLDCGIKIDEV